ncbi:MAG: muconolactone Delta-isomerase family protein [Verrucomicrobiota bacterium]
MRVLALEHDLSLTIRPDLSDIQRAEAAAVWDLQKRGIIREIWFTAGRHRAIIMLECASTCEARNHLATLPLVHQGLSEFDLLELTAYDGYERLFGAGLVPAARHEEPPEY